MRIHATYILHTLDFHFPTFSTFIYFFLIWGWGDVYLGVAAGGCRLALLWVLGWGMKERPCGECCWLGLVLLELLALGIPPLPCFKPPAKRKYFNVSRWIGHMCFIADFNMIMGVEKLLSRLKGFVVNSIYGAEFQ